jgi:hypothetical protein
LLKNRDIPTETVIAGLTRNPIAFCHYGLDPQSPNPFYEQEIADLIRNPSIHNQLSSHFIKQK